MMVYITIDLYILATILVYGFLQQGISDWVNQKAKEACLEVLVAIEARVFLSLNMQGVADI